MIRKIISNLGGASKGVASMLPSEQSLIRSFAKGDVSLRGDAIAIHRKYIPTIGVRGDAYQRFMAEVDHPCPDLNLRTAYRAAVLDMAE